MNKEELARRWAANLREKAVRIEPLFREGNRFDIKMLGEHQVLLLLLQIAILLLAAFICGEVVSRMGQPAVIGQMLAGIILGKSVFGALCPTLAGVVFPVESSQSNLLEVVSWFGVIFLLMLTGLETDVELIKRQGKSALGASILGIIVPFSTGFGFAYIIPEDLLLNPQHRTIVALFLGTVFAVSSVPVIAKILMDMQLLRRNVAQVILATALVHDTIGCIILALVAAIASTNASPGPELLKAPVGTALFLAVVYIGRRQIFSLLRWINDTIQSDTAIVTAITVMLLLSAALTQFLGVHVVLGAFIVGLLLAQTPIIGKRVIHPLEIVTMSIFAPIFFAAAGLHVNIGLLADPKLLFLTILMSLMACASKICANFVGGRWGGLSKWEALCLSFGANAPGAMGLIVGILGYSMGIINVEMLSIIIVMSLITTAITPPLLKWALKNITMSDQEVTRLEQEERKAKTIIAQMSRILLPVSDGLYSQFHPWVIKAIAEEQKIEVTALGYSTADQDRAAAAEELNSRAAIVGDGLDKNKVTVIKKMADTESPATSIVDEARIGYDLIVMGTSPEEIDGTHVFNETIDKVVMESPCPVLVVRRPKGGEEWSLKRMLIPSTGADTSNQAAEIGLLVARSIGAESTALSVVESMRVADEEVEKVAMEAASDVAGSITELAGALEADLNTTIRLSGTASQEIIKAAADYKADAILLSGEKRPTRALFLGTVVKNVLSDAECAVLVYIG